jgi:hypothetical protein
MTCNLKWNAVLSYFFPPNPPELGQWLRGAYLFHTLEVLPGVLNHNLVCVTAFKDM